MAELRRGKPDAAWDLFVTRYRRLLFAAIRHYAEDYDDVMDVFARVCEALREDDFRRLRSWMDAPVHRARFTTWLVTVVRHITVDWFRSRDGRRRVSRLVESLAPLRQRIFELVFVDRRSHVEAYELIRTRDAPDLSFGAFLGELRATYQAVSHGRRGALLHPPLPDAALDGGAILEASAAPEAGSDQRAALERALATLPAEDRVAVELYVVEELPAADVARMLGLASAKTVYNRAYRALEALRAHFDKAGLGREDL